VRRSIFLAAVFAVLALAPSGAAVVTLQKFFEYDRAPTYGVVKTSLMVATRDGTKLGCYLYRPATPAGVPAAGKFPGLIIEYLPYWTLDDAAGLIDEQGNYYSSRGYVALHCTPRGSGLSGGTWQGWLSEIENRDNYDIIEWLAHQPFSTGKIGQEGESYGGMSSYRVASLQPPHLVAIAPQQAYSSQYLEQGYYGGIRGTADPFWALVAGMGLGDPAMIPYPQLTDWLAHPLLDDYWLQIDIWSKYAQIKVPILGFGGWLDLFQDGMPRNYIGLKSHAWLIDGPWGHGNTFQTGVTRGTTLAWFDHWLLGLGSAPMPPSRIMSYEMPSGPWRTYSDWPPKGSGSTTLALNTSGTMGKAGSAGSNSYVADPAAGVDPNTSATSLTFASAPLGSDLLVTGTGSIQLTATLSDPTGVLGALGSSVVETNFVFHLYDVAPDGTSTNVTQGYLKASHRLSHTYPTILDLGVPTSYTIPLWHTDWRFRAGHSLKLVLAAGDQSTGLSGAPAPLQPIPPLTVTVATGQGGSFMQLPVSQ
jgi:predicted acyl esterase